MESSSNGATEKDWISKSQFFRVHSDILRRAAVARGGGLTFNGNRDLYDTLGYERNLTYDHYRERYSRGGIAARLINSFSGATWRESPTVREKGKEDETEESPFETAWNELVSRLNIFRVFERVDRLSTIGHYATIVVGLRGQTSWITETTQVSSQEDVLYLSAYSEDHAKIESLVTDQNVSNYGKPKRYTIDFSRSAKGNSSAAGGLSRPTMSGGGAGVLVHASRVIHIAEDGLEDDVIGTPRLRAVWNYLDDLEKIVGGTSEMVWQDAKRRIILSLQADAELDPNEASKISDEVDEFMHELRSFLRVQGMDVTQLEGKIPDASNNVEELIALISGTVGIPKRMLVGSERGELASSQDENNWAARIMERQNQFASPVIIRQFIDFMIRIGALPVPVNGYEIDWENLLAETEKEKSETALNWSKVFKEYAGSSGNPEDVLPLAIFLEDIVGWDKKQVERIIELLELEIRTDIEIDEGITNAA